MLDRTGQQSHWVGGVKISKREGRRKRPRSHAIQRGEQASEPGLCDGNAGGGQGQMLMESSPEMQPPPAQSHPLIFGGPVVEMFKLGQGLSTQSLNPCSCFLPLCAPELSPQALSHSKPGFSTVLPQATATSPHWSGMSGRAGKGLYSLPFPTASVHPGHPALLKLQGPSPVLFSAS